MSKVLIVSGPAGAGKTTASKQFAETAEGTWAYIAQDEIRNFIHAGFKYPTKNWDDGAKLQWEVSSRIIVDMIKRYQEAGINCIVDGFSPDLKGSYAASRR